MASIRDTSPERDRLSSRDGARNQIVSQLDISDQLIHDSHPLIHDSHTELDNTNGLPSPESPIENINDLYKVQKDMPFRAYDIERMAERVFVHRLKNMQYDAIKCRQLSHSLAAEIMDRVKTLAIRRYKIIAMVSIGSLKERPGMQFGSQCLWDKNTDNFVSVKYTNNSLFAVAMIYGLLFQ